MNKLNRDLPKRYMVCSSSRRMGKTNLAIQTLIKKGYTLEDVENSVLATPEFKQAFKRYIENHGERN